MVFKDVQAIKNHIYKGILLKKPFYYISTPEYVLLCHDEIAGLLYMAFIIYMIAIWGPMKG